jgi:hypothetical protein
MRLHSFISGNTEIGFLVQCSIGHKEKQAWYIHSENECLKRFNRTTAKLPLSYIDFTRGLFLNYN